MQAEKPNTTFVMPAPLYDFLKKFIQVILPAFSAAYFGLAQIWGLPAPDKVCGTCAVVATFVGVLIGVAKTQYNNAGLGYDGTVQVIQNTEGAAAGFNINPEDLVHKDSVTIKVLPPKIAPPPAE